MKAKVKNASFWVLQRSPHPGNNDTVANFMFCFQFQVSRSEVFIMKCANLKTPKIRLIFIQEITEYTILSSFLARHGEGDFRQSRRDFYGFFFFWYPSLQTMPSLLLDNLHITFSSPLIKKERNNGCPVATGAYCISVYTLYHTHWCPLMNVPRAAWLRKQI